MILSSDSAPNEESRLSMTAASEIRADIRTMFALLATYHHRASYGLDDEVIHERTGLGLKSKIKRSLVTEVDKHSHSCKDKK